MLAEISNYYGKFPDGKTLRYTNYAGVYCKCGRVNFVKKENLSSGDNAITCKFCGRTVMLFIPKRY